MYNYEQQVPVYGQPVEFLYARGLQPGLNMQTGMNMQPGIGGFVSGVRQTMHSINGLAPMPRAPVQQVPPGPQYVQSQVMPPQIMHVEEGRGRSGGGLGKRQAIVVAAPRARVSHKLERFGSGK